MYAVDVIYIDRTVVSLEWLCLCLSLMFPSSRCSPAASTLEWHQLFVCKVWALLMRPFFFFRTDYLRSHSCLLELQVWEWVNWIMGSYHHAGGCYIQRQLGTESGNKIGIVFLSPLLPRQLSTWCSVPSFSSSQRQQQLLTHTCGFPVEWEPRLNLHSDLLTLAFVCLGNGPGKKWHQSTAWSLKWHLTLVISQKASGSRNRTLRLPAFSLPVYALLEW